MRIFKGIIYQRRLLSSGCKQQLDMQSLITAPSLIRKNKWYMYQEVVYVAIGNLAFCLALYLTGVHFRGELQHVGHVCGQKFKHQPIRTREIGDIRLQEELYANVQWLSVPLRDTFISSCLFIMWWNVNDVLFLISFHVITAWSNFSHYFFRTHTNRMIAQIRGTLQNNYSEKGLANS